MGGCSTKTKNSCSFIPCCGYHSKRLEKYDLNPDWMGQLTQNNPHARLRDLRMIESHDTLTCYISRFKPFHSVSITQKITLREQLELGVRMLDIRFAPLKTNMQADNHFSIQHGIHKGSNFYLAMKEVADFLVAHPQEFIILNCMYEKKSHKKMSVEQSAVWISTMNAIFRKISINKQDFYGWFDRGGATLKEIQSSSKRVLIAVNENILDAVQTAFQEDFKLYLEDNCAFYKPLILYDRWHDVGHQRTLFCLSDKFLSEYAKEETLMINQLILTPQTNMGNLLKYVCCLDSLRVDQKTRQLHTNKRLQRHVRKIAHYYNWNALAIDMVDYDPSITKFVNGLNFKIRLQILEAKLFFKDWPLNITNQLSKLIINGNSLWVISWKHDLGINSELDGQARLDISFTIDEEGLIVIKRSYPISEKHDFLLNAFSFRILFQTSDLNPSAEREKASAIEISEAQARSSRLSNLPTITITSV